MSLTGAPDMDVLIVGSGPCGLALACELATQGVSFRIVDKRPQLAPWSRAIAIQPRSIELLGRYGDSGALAAQGVPIRGANIFVNRKLTSRLDLASAQIGYHTAPAPIVMMSQTYTEEWLAARLAEKGGHIEWDVAATGLVQDNEGVQMELVGGDGTNERVRTRYVVGCDGAHSFVRKAAGMSFRGELHPQPFVLADCHVRWPYPRDEAVIILDSITMLCGPIGPNLVRFQLVDRAGLFSKRDMTMPDLQKLLDRALPDKVELYDLKWVSDFRINMRGVENYSSGRVFLAGDAAHIHTPAGGQGMNTAIQDAVNLGWKLGHVLRGEQPESLLDSYHKERHPVGEYLSTHGDRYFGYFTMGNDFLLWLRTLIMPFLLRHFINTPTRVQKIVRYTSQLTVSYRKSAIVGTAGQYRGSLRGGDRVPNGKLMDVEGSSLQLHDLLRGPGFHLLVFTGRHADSKKVEEVAKLLQNRQEKSESVMMHVIRPSHSDLKTRYVDVQDELHTLLAFADGGYIYARPDMYTAHVGPLSAMDEFKSWLEG